MGFLFKLVERLKQMEWFPLLVMRVTLGLAFFLNGKGKLGQLPNITKYFESLGVPMPGVNAVMASATECVGGLCILVGFLTRIFGAMLAFVMVVAMATAKLCLTGGKGCDLPDGWAKMSCLSQTVTVFGFNEWLYMVMFGLLIFTGPGKISLDHLISRRLEGRR
jgi:putative oxidoreductase